MGSDDARTAIAQAVAGWPAPERDRLLAAVDKLAAGTPTYADPPEFSDAARDAARAVADRLRAGEDDPPGRAAVAALTPDDAGRLMEDLVAAGRVPLLAQALRNLDPRRMPAGRVLEAAVAQPAGVVRRALVLGVSSTSTLRVLRGIAELLGSAVPAPGDLASVVEEVAAAREKYAGQAFEWWDTTVHLEPMGSTSHAEPPTAAEAPPEEPVFRDGEADRSAYPRLEVSGTERPDVVVVDQPFTVTFGIGPRRDRALVGSGALSFAPGETVELEVVLLYDPTSIEVTERPRATLTVTDLQPYPSVSLTCTARYGEDLSPERRLGLQVLRDGAVVGVAWRTIVAVDTADRVAAAVVPVRRDVELLDLSPLVGDQAPDLVVSVCRADAGSNTFVWTAYAADPTVQVPDLPSTSTLEDDVAAFATETRRSIQFSADPSQDYVDLAGRAIRIGRAVPPSVQDALRAVVGAAGRTTAPAVLLLTEELTVPWELAAPTPPLASTWGGTSPFLGAHAAISRWPLTEHQPRPRPRSAVAVRTGLVLTADYTGVAGWGRLESAVQEAADVAKLFDPPAATVEPEMWTVIDLFRSKPPGDVLHLALHGQYDGQGNQEGIVLLAKSPAGGATAQFLTATALETGALDQGPFVFLNACQVGTDERVLGDYGGFASTLLRIGATGVVAPLWNVKDDVAGTLARQFYAATLTAADPVPVAEAVRAIRATYTEEGVRAGTPGLHATLVAYQVFGHPRLRLTRATT